MPKWLEINQDNLHIKFLALNLDFSSQYSDPLRLTRPAHAGVKEQYPLKLIIFPIFACKARKWLQIDTDMLLIITSTGDLLFRSINIDVLESP